MNVTVIHIIGTQEIRPS